jgi:hypothetical protein
VRCWKSMLRTALQPALPCGNRQWLPDNGGRLSFITQNFTLRCSLNDFNGNETELVID